MNPPSPQRHPLPTVTSTATRPLRYAAGDSPVATRARGAAGFARLMGGHADEALDGVREASPAMHDWLLGGAFAGPLSGSDLTMAQRELATVAVLSALGDSRPQLAAHAAAALRHGITPTELRAIATHVSVYAGFPRALNALTVIDDVLAGVGEPPAAALHHVVLDDHATTVAQVGAAGEPVLLVHALGLDWRMWEPVMDRLAVGRRVFAHDLRGHGSAAEAPQPLRLDELANDMIAVMDALGLEQAHVVGLSYGGGIVQTAAALAPERFASMTLMATTDVAFEAFEGRARSIERDGMAAQVSPSLVRWFTPEGLATDGWGVRYARDSVLRGDPRQMAAAWRAFRTIDVRGRRDGFAAPTLVLAGECDASTTPQVMTRLADGIPGARYRELPGTPHMPTLEKPDLVVAALDEFLPAAARDDLAS